MANGPVQQVQQDAGATGGRRFPHSTFLDLVILCGSVFALYAATLRNGFVADDDSEVLQDPLIRSFHDLPKLFAHSVWYFSGAEGDRYYRPLKLLAYSAEYHLFHFRAAFWHLTNLALHAGMVVAIYFLVRELARGPAAEGPTMAEGTARQLSFWTALLFAFHPIHTEAVAWVAGGNDLWCGLALVISLGFYHRGRSALRPALSCGLSAILFFAALLFKETALTFPAIILAYDFLYLGEPLRKLAGNWPRYSGYLAALGIYLLMRWHALGGFAPNNPANVLPAAQLALTVPMLAAQYVWKTIVPVNLDAWYTFRPVTALGWRPLAAVALVAVLVWAMFWLRRRRPLLSFSLAWFGLALIPVLDIPKLGRNVFAERYLYIPTLGFCVIAAWGWQRLRERVRQPAASGFAYAAIAGLLVFYSFVTVRRLPDWRGNYALWTKTARQDPNDPVPLVAAGTACLDRHDYVKALPLLQRAVTLAPNQGYTHDSLGGAYFDLHRYDLALSEYRRAVTLGPGDAGFWINLGVVYANYGRWQQATDAFGRAISLELASAPPAPTLHYYEALSLLYVQYGTSLENGDLPDRAASAFRSAIQTESKRLDAYIGLARILTEQYHLDEATAALQSGLRVNPASPQAYLAHLALGRIYLQEGMKSQAQTEFQQAIALSPASGPQPVRFVPFQFTGRAKPKPGQ